MAPGGTETDAGYDAQLKLEKYSLMIQVVERADMKLADGRVMTSLEAPGVDGMRCEGHRAWLFRQIGLVSLVATHLHFQIFICTAVTVQSVDVKREAKPCGYCWPANSPMTTFWHDTSSDAYRLP